MSTSPVAPRHMFRRLLRELSKQHNIASKQHAEKDKKRLAALVKYQQMKDAAAGIKADPQAIEKALTKGARFDSTILRELFTNGQVDKSASHQDYLLAVSVYLTSQRTYKELLELYNGSLIDDGERLHLSARRVGLELPK